MSRDITKVELIGWLSHPTDAMLDGIPGMMVAGRR